MPKGKLKVKIDPDMIPRICLVNENGVVIAELIPTKSNGDVDLEYRETKATARFLAQAWNKMISEEARNA